MQIFRHPNFYPAVIRPVDHSRGQDVQPAVIVPLLLVQFLVRKVMAGRIA